MNKLNQPTGSAIVRVQPIPTGAQVHMQSVSADPGINANQPIWCFYLAIAMHAHRHDVQAQHNTAVRLKLGLERYIQKIDRNPGHRLHRQLTDAILPLYGNCTARLIAHLWNDMVTHDLVVLLSHMIKSKITIFAEFPQQRHKNKIIVCGQQYKAPARRFHVHLLNEHYSLAIVQ